MQMIFTHGARPTATRCLQSCQKLKLKAIVYNIKAICFGVPFKCIKDVPQKLSEEYYPLNILIRRA